MENSQILHFDPRTLDNGRHCMVVEGMCPASVLCFFLMLAVFNAADK